MRKVQNGQSPRDTEQVAVPRGQGEQNKGKLLWVLGFLLGFWN